MDATWRAKQKYVTSNPDLSQSGTRNWPKPHCDHKQNWWKTRWVRTVGFRAYHRKLEPNHKANVAFKAFTPQPPRPKSRPLPHHRCIMGNPPTTPTHVNGHKPTTKSFKLRYQQGSNMAPPQQIPKSAKMVPLTMRYCYKRNWKGHIVGRKAQ